MLDEPTLSNEADVREDFIAPLIAALGYRKGTEFDVLREYNLVYPRSSLGRKKKNDPPLKGKADYILSVAGSGKWVIEAKPPTVKISNNDIEQALTYARHPEVSAVICVITNGKETHICHAMAPPGDKACNVIFEKIPQELANYLRPILGSCQFQEKFRPKPLNLAGGIAPGYPDRCRILAGKAIYRDISWTCNYDLPNLASQMNSLRENLLGFVSHLRGGEISLTENGVVVSTSWLMQNDKMETVAQSIGLSREMKFVTQGLRISNDCDSATHFDAIIDLSINAGDAVAEGPFSPIQFSQISMNMSISARAKGYLQRNILMGQFFTEYYFSFPELPELQLYLEGLGDFEFILEV